MTLAQGRTFLSIPGPSVVPDRVLQAMHRPSMNIYEGELVDMSFAMLDDLRRVARTEANVAIYIANGHGAWEAAIANTLAPGDHALVLATGRFGKGWSEMAMACGVEAEVMDFGTKTPVDAAALQARLEADTEHQIKAVLVCHTDTSTSIRSDIPTVRAAMDAARHPALLQVDCIASLGCEPFEMDAWGVDVMVTGCQKGLMTPPGMSFVYFNDKARAVRDAMPRVSSYWDWNPRANPELFYQLFCGTAPTHHLYGLREALTMLLEEEGLEAAWARHEKLASAIWAAGEAWGSTGDIHLNVADPAHRSTAVTTFRTAGEDAARLREWSARETGVTLGIGLGIDAALSPHGKNIFRIGHMGHVNPPMIMGALAAADAGLKALGIAHGAGALDAANAALLAR